MVADMSYMQPHVDFGFRLLGGDVMAIPGLYQYVQVNLSLSLCNLYTNPIGRSRLTYLA